jgi:hypothetical protein
MGDGERIPSGRMRGRILPHLTIPQVCYVESMGGYSTLMALSIKDAEAMTDEGIQLHIKWAGAEPFFSQAAAPGNQPSERDGRRSREPSPTAVARYTEVGDSVVHRHLQRWRRR